MRWFALRKPPHLRHLAVIAVAVEAAIMQAVAPVLALAEPVVETAIVIATVVMADIAARRLVVRLGPLGPAPNFLVRRVTVPQPRAGREGATRHRQSTPPKDLARRACRFAQPARKAAGSVSQNCSVKTAKERRS